MSLADRTHWAGVDAVLILMRFVLFAYRFESQHILHYISEKNVPKWVALAEGAGGALGWLTVRHP